MKTFAKNILLCLMVCLIIPTLTAATCSTTEEKMNLALAHKMFASPDALWAIAKTDNSYAQVYDPGFVFYGNGLTETYQQFKDHMRQNRQHWKKNHNQATILDSFANGNKVTLRLHVSAIAASGKHYALDSIEIIEFKNNRVFRWWETAYPDWRTMIAKEGEKIS